jgi:hypothetical protein
MAEKSQKKTQISANEGKWDLPFHSNESCAKRAAKNLKKVQKRKSISLVIDPQSKTIFETFLIKG